MLAVKKQKVACKYKAEWSKCGLKPSKKGATCAFCSVCNTDICVAEGGKTAVDCHMKTAKHTNVLSQMETQPILTAFITDSRTKRSSDES